MLKNRATLKHGKSKCGTTIVAVKYTDGIILAGDSRVTIEEDIINRFADKLVQLRENIFCCRSGAEADTHVIIERVTYHLSLLSLELKMEPTVKMASSMFHEMCYKNREYMECSMICAGWDSGEGFQIYDIPFDGLCVSQPYAMAGSGSSYIASLMDFQFRENMNRKECLELAEKAVTLGIRRDGSSGGVVRMMDITKHGWSPMLVSHDHLKHFASEVT